ncbi:MAG: ATP-binding protein [Prevotella sp.]
MKKISRFTGIIAALLALVGIIFCTTFACKKVPRYHVHVIFSQENGDASYDDMREAFEDQFDKLGDKVSLSYSYLCCERWDHDHEVAEAKRILTKEVDQNNTDLIITIGDQASYSVMVTGTDIVKTLPVVFGGVLYPNQKLLDKFPNYTGFRDSIDVVANIHASYALTRNYATYTLLDATYLDKCTRRLINEQIAEVPDILDNMGWLHSIYHVRTQPAGIYSITPFSLRDLASNTAQNEKRDSLGANNFIFVMRRYSGMTYIQMKYDTEALAMIRMNGSKAMMTAIGADFGNHDRNFIGGYFAPCDEIAREVATRASKILHGADPKSFKIGISKKDYYIDWDVAKRNGFTPENLPEGFNVINLSWSDKHPKLYLLSTYSGAFVSIVLIMFLLWLLQKERRKRQKVQRRVERENTLYNMAVANSKTFAWERVGETINIGDAFWTHYGKKPHPICVEDFMQMVHPDSRKAYTDGVDAVNRGEEYTGEIEADFAGNGTYHWYLLRGKGIFNSEGKYVRSYGMLMKIDELKMREHELEEARRMAEEATLKESFLANMSHEIRTPLNAIVGFSNLILQPDADFTAEEKQMFADTINTNNDLLLKLINDILDLSRVESGEMQFVVKEYSVKELMEKVYNSFAVQMPKHLAFNLVQPKGDMIVRIDDSRIQQVLGNFLTNASKFTKEGSVTLGWDVDKAMGMVEMYVEDTGIGLSEEDRKMVFSRFYKKNEFQQGTGLGLSICKAIVIRLGGKIKVKSELGKGSRFSIFFACKD